MTENLDGRSDMKLPKGKTCYDCEHYKRCFMLFQCQSNSQDCDWSPSRFNPKENKE